MKMSRTIFLLFFISGVCGLVYQVIWVRMFGLVFGNTLYASSTVLTAFMAGLALGSFYAGRYLSNRDDGLRLYAAMEIVIGISGICMPGAIKLIAFAYTWMYHGFHPSFELLTVVRFALSFSVLLVPCTFMGATLPVISRLISESRNGNPDDAPGKVYGINTIGAAAGCFFAGFVLIHAMGTTGTTILAAMTNGMVGCTAFFISGGKSGAGHPATGKKSRSTAVDAAPEPAGSGIAGKILIASYALSGFAAMALEITWAKALAWVFQMVWSFQMDSYAFAAMLCVVLAGIGCGSILISFFIAGVKNVNRLLCAVQVVLGGFVVVSIVMVQNAVWCKGVIYSIVNSPVVSGLSLVLAGFLGIQALMQLLLAVAMLFVPSVLMGIAFPLFARAYFQVTGNIGKSVGSIYAANTIGGIAGSLAAGFLLVPAIGLLPALAVSAGCYFVTALAVFSIAKETRAVRWVVGVCIFIGAVVLLRSADLDYSHFLASTMPPASSGYDGKTVYFKEHAGGAVLVRESGAGGREMLSDGVTVASTACPNLFSHVFPAHLISLLAKGPRDILVIGFGSGITSGSMLLYDEVTTLDALEINRGMIGPAKKYFTDANNSAFADRRLNLIFQDGKNYVKMAEKRYDVIYASPSMPQANSGSAGLFTKEFFSDCRRRLDQGGFQCLWVPLHMYRPDEFLTVVKTFQSVYPHVALWHPYQNELAIGLAYLIGSDGPLDPDYRAIAEKLKRPAIRRDIARLCDGAFQTPEEFISIFSMGEGALKNVTAAVTAINSDEHPVVEFYRRSGDLMQAAIMSKLKLVELLGKNSEDPFPYVQNVPDEEKAVVQSTFARMYSGNQYLVMGHAMRTYKEFLSATGSCPPELDEKIRQCYSLASGLVPENLFLKGYFGKQ